MPIQSLFSRFHAYFRSSKGRRVGLWLAYFTFWGAAAAVLPYVPLYYESVNLSGSQIGQLNSIPFFIAMFSSVFFGILSDVSKKNKLLLRVCVVGMISALFLFPRVSTFTAFIPIVLIYSMFQAPANPILDETTLTVLEKPELYGRVRVGGSIGWGLMVLATGFLIDNLGLGIPVIFYLNIAYLLVFFLIISVIPEPASKKTMDRPKVTFGKIGEMFRKPGFILIFVLIIIWGMGEASITNFLFLHIKQLGGSSTLMGTALSISLIGEIVTFSIANKIQEKIGELKMILLAFIVLIAWLTGLALIKDPNMIPLFQIFGGAGFALMHSGSVAYVNRRAPKELGTTAQALRGGLYSGFGVGIGTLLSGRLYEFMGSSSLYQTMAFIQLGGFILGVVVYLRDRRAQSAKAADLPE
ncbi:MAG: MFS transporter [Pelolinea sp.]|nr:MFS transporter [Pelolinea sp.]